MAKRPPQSDRMRNLIAHESAKIIASEGIKDFAKAKRKAAARIGITNRTVLPSNIEIEQALVEYQRLFLAMQQPQHLLILRQTALQAMQFLTAFRPRLVGPVLQGTADSLSIITLHVFADTVEDILFYLLNHNVVFTTTEHRLKLANDHYREFPAINFVINDTDIDLTVFGQKDRDLPLSPIDGRPMQRANFSQVQAMINTEY